MKGRVGWRGDEDYRTAFKNKFYRMCQLSGDVLFTDSDSAQKRMIQILANRQGHALRDETQLSDVKKLLPFVLTSGNYNIYLEHVEEVPSKQSLGGVYICDLEQRPHGGLAVPGPYFPTQLTHGLITMLHGDRVRFATGLDHLSAMGWHLTEGSTMDHALSPLFPAIRELSNEELKFVSGNAIHLCPLTAWMHFIVGKCAAPLKHSAGFRVHGYVPFQDAVVMQ